MISSGNSLAECAAGSMEKNGTFSTTLWTVVLNAADDSSQNGVEALETLCRIYWYPLYVFIRRRGHDGTEAEDLTQAFFAHLFERDALKQVAREKGKFRTFLLTSLTHFLNNEYDKRRARKRGGGRILESWDELQAEDRYRHEPADPISPERLFERRWAFTVIEQVLSQLRQEYEASGRLQVFEELQPLLVADNGPGTITMAAGHLGISEGAVKVAIHRLRRRFGEKLRAQLAGTVATPDQVEEEIRYLFAVIGE